MILFRNALNFNIALVTQAILSLPTVSDEKTANKSSALKGFKKLFCWSKVKIYSLNKMKKYDQIFAWTIIVYDKKLCKTTKY